ncbi:hypothetical protein Dimus_039582 [Dionaea muscipula]
MSSFIVIIVAGMDIQLPTAGPVFITAIIVTKMVIQMLFAISCINQEIMLIKKNPKTASGLDNRKGQRHTSAHDTHSTANVAQSIPATGQSNPFDLSVLQGLTADQYQQLATAVSMVKSSSSSEAFANAAGFGYGEDDWVG